MLLMCYLLFSTAMMFTYMINPISMSALIILSSVLVSIIILNLLPTSWFSFLLLTTFLSAMMIIFLYVSALATNNLGEINFSYFSLMFMVVMITFMTQNPHLTQSNLIINLSPHVSMMTQSLYMNQMYLMTLILTIYLLITLLAVVKNCKVLNKPLRSKK